MIPSLIVRKDAGLSRALQSRFPFLLGRIDWRRVPGAVTRSVAGNEAGRTPESVVQFLRDNVEVEGTLAVVGDNTEDEYEIALPDLHALLADMGPQHVYVFAPDASWCVMWSMEDELHFGRAPTAGR